MSGLIDAWSSGMLRALVQGGLVALLAWAAVRCLPRLPAAWRAVLLWLVALRLLAAFALPWGLALPLLPPVETGHAAAAPVAFGAPGVLERPEPLAGSTGGAVPRPAWRVIDVLAAAWLAGAGFRSARIVRDLVTLRRVRRRARPLPGAPDVLVSDDVAVPCAAGLVRPRVIVPSSLLAAAGGPALDLVLAHERAHIARHDLLLGWVPALADALFWFFPPARWCAREYALAREQACDAHALAATRAPVADYARLIVTFGAARPAFAGRCGAALPFRQLERRLRMLAAPRPSARTLVVAGLIFAVVAAATLVPVRLARADERVPPLQPVSTTGEDRRGAAVARPGASGPAQPLEPG